VELLERTYEAQHPTIGVRWLDMGSQEVYDRIRSEKVNPQADGWFGGPDTIFSRGADEGLLEPFAPAWADSLPPTSRHPSELYHGLYEAVPILVFVIRDPLASGTMRTAFGMVLSNSVSETGDTAAGFEWLASLDRQTKDYVVNPALLFEKLIRQEGLVSIWELTDMLFLQQRGAPLDYNFPQSGTPIINDSIGEGVSTGGGGGGLHRLGRRSGGASIGGAGGLPAAGKSGPTSRRAAGVGSGGSR